ncbi:MAG TPA: hypothetical protein VKT70_07770 [Stellaceae bacterium]|nr:hypothetical protein [Stellaceae bacterium]
MFRDQSLTPTEAARLASLGFLAEAPRHYGDLALEVRHFTSRIIGPSLDLMGTSLEALRLEGLVAAIEGQGMSDNATLRLTEAGEAALEGLLKAKLKGVASELNRLALLLKLRFLHHLAPADQAAQLAGIVSALEKELALLRELRKAPAPALFLDWIDQDIASTLARRAMLGR